MTQLEVGYPSSHYQWQWRMCGSAWNTNKLQDPSILNSSKMFRIFQKNQKLVGSSTYDPSTLEVIVISSQWTKTRIASGHSKQKSFPAIQMYQTQMRSKTRSVSMNKLVHVCTCCLPLAPTNHWSRQLNDHNHRIISTIQQPKTLDDSWMVPCAFVWKWSTPKTNHFIHLSHPLEVSENGCTPQIIHVIFGFAIINHGKSHVSPIPFLAEWLR